MDALSKGLLFTGEKTHTRKKKCISLYWIRTFHAFNRLFSKLPAGLEPATHALRMRCATNCATEASKMLWTLSKAFYDLSGNRTRVYAVRGRRLDRLTNRP